MSLQLGLAAEKAACEFLLCQGLTFVMSNYRCRMGEIDLIMREGDYLVFVEVRTRISKQYGGALYSVTKDKQKKIIKTALFYLTAHQQHDKWPIRFDVLAMDGVPHEVTWVKNAFGSDF